MTMTPLQEEEAGASFAKRTPKASKKQKKKREHDGGKSSKKSSKRKRKDSAKKSSKRRRKTSDADGEGSNGGWIIKEDVDERKASPTNEEGGNGGEEVRGGKDGAGAKEASPGKEKYDSGRGVEKSKKSEDDSKEKKSSSRKKSIDGEGGGTERKRMGKTEVSKKMGEAFKALTEDSSKRKKGEKEKPHKEEEDDGGGGGEAKEGGGDDGGDGGPKRPLNAYFLFLNDARSWIKGENPGASAQEITTKLGAAYRDLDDDVRKRYEKAAAAAKAKFIKEHGEEAFKRKKKTVKKKEQQRNSDGGGAGAKGDGEEGPPKRPPDAYLVFAGEICKKIKRENPGLNRVELSKKISEAFGALGEDDRQRYDDMAREALDSFNEVPGDFSGNSKRKRGEKDKPQEDDDDGGSDGEAEKEGDDDGKDERPKRPLNAYILFSNDVRSRIKEENPGLSAKEVMTKIGEAYRDLDGDAKKRYVEAADAARAKFKEEHGDKAFKPKKKRAEKKKQRQSSDGGAQRHSLDGIPAEPAKGLPDGWMIRLIPRKTGDRSDSVWFSPAESYKFRSLVEVKRFQESLEEVDGDDEVAAMKLHTQKEKQRKNGRSGGHSGKSAKEEQKMAGTEKDGDGGRVEDG